MNGIIITTGQRPSTGGIRKIANRSGHFAWKGVEGVTYPDEARGKAQSCQQKMEKPTGKGWVTTVEAAKILKVSGASARRKLHAAKAQSALGKGKTNTLSNTLYWKRSDVEALAKSEDFEHVSCVPEGWVTTAQACEQFGVTRSVLQRYYISGKIHSRRVRLKNSRNNTMTLLAVDDVKVLAKMQEIRKKAEEECRAIWTE